MGLLGRPGAGACPNLPQRRSGPRSAAKKSAEYQRFSSGVPARSGPLWQIWTTGAAAGPVGRAVVRLGEVHGVGAGAGTGEAGGCGPGGCPVRPHWPRPSNAADPAQALRSARSPLNPRERTSSRRSRGLPGDLAGYPAISRVTRRSRGPPRRSPTAPHHRPLNNLPGSAAKKSAEYQRFFSRASARSGSLWQIWTTRRRGPAGEEVVARLGEVHDVGVGVGTGEAGDRPPRPARGAPPATAPNSRPDQIHAAPTALTRTRGMLGARETVDARGQDRG